MTTTNPDVPPMPQTSQQNTPSTPDHPDMADNTQAAPILAALKDPAQPEAGDAEKRVAPTSSSLDAPTQTSTA
ncbi:hypothetical protein, partial [Acetobacter tropicalis]